MREKMHVRFYTTRKLPKQFASQVVFAPPIHTFAVDGFYDPNHTASYSHLNSLVHKFIIHIFRYGLLRLMDFLK